MDWEPGALFESIGGIELDGKAVEAPELGLAVVFGWGWYGFCGIVGKASNYEAGTQIGSWGLCLRRFGA